MNNFRKNMNSKFMFSMGIAVIGLAVGFILLHDIQQEKRQKKDIVKTSLDTA